jgi:NADH-quinone oxidoreductase subunit G
MDKKMKYQMAEDVFEEMAKTIDVLKNIDYDDIGDTGIALELQSVNV